MPMAGQRDPDRRRDSKKAYYKRHKERLRLEARERAARQRASNSPLEEAERLRDKRQKTQAYREFFRDHLRYKSLNQRRIKYIREHGLQAFRQKFISRAKNVPDGVLLEDFDDEIVARFI